MNPALLLQIANWISVAISAAKNLKPAVEDAIAFVKGLFGSGLITKEQQDALMGYVDACTLAFVHDDPPPAWTVEPDPE